MPTTTSLYLQDATLTAITERGDNRSEIVNRDLQRLYDLYRRALGEIQLTEAEALLICDALNGTIHASSVPARMVLYAQVDDAIRIYGLDRKWIVDGNALLEKIHDMSEVQALAIIDAVERFWTPARIEEASEQMRRVFGPAIKS